MGRESYAASGWSVRFHVPGINAQARRKMEGTSFTKSGTYSTHPPQTGQTYCTPSVHIKQTPNPACPYPHPRPSPPPSSSPSPPPVILDISNRGSRVFLFFHSSPRHLPAPAGVAAPQSRTLYGGEDCLSEASSAALTVGTGAKAPGGPRPGANGFGSFCRNKRTSSCGAETPQEPLPLPLAGEGWGEGKEVEAH